MNLKRSGGYLVADMKGAKGPRIQGFEGNVKGTNKVFKLQTLDP